MALLELHDIVKSFQKNGKPVRVLDNVTVSVEEGKCLGLVGQSGCGKSTLARIASRLTEADGGKILFDGSDITELKGSGLRPVYDGLQMIFQQPESSFNPRRLLGWSISEPLRRHGVSEGDCRERTAQLLREVGLDTDYAERYPHEVSGGECQRAAIARALALNPKLLICDEITSALDVTIQREITALIRSLVEKGMTCIFITHDLALLNDVADYVAVMEKGKIVETGSTVDITSHPKSSAARELLEAALFEEGFEGLKSSGTQNNS